MQTQVNQSHKKTALKFKEVRIADLKRRLSIAIAGRDREEIQEIRELLQLERSDG